MSKILFTSCLLLLNLACSSDTPPPVAPEVPAPELSVDWIGAVEAGLRVRSNASGRVVLQLSRDDSVVFSGSVSAAETTLVQMDLLPNRSYRYQAARIEGSNMAKSSEVLTLVTLDTTSHDFVWEKLELGNLGGYLKDVVAISKNDVWAGGFLPVHPMSNVNMNNAVHWDGAKWTIHQLKISNCDESGNLFGSPNPIVIESVFGSSTTDLWFVWGGGKMIHWDGSEFQQVCLPLVYLNGHFVNKLWGTSPTNLYGVGDNGFIMHYDGADWQAMASGTEVDLQDVWGTADGSVVWACGWTDNVGTVLLAYQNNQWRVVYFDSENRFNIRQDTLSSIWTSVWTNNSTDISILAPAGLYIAPSHTGGEAWLRKWFTDTFAPGFPRRVRGTAPNDLFVVGDFSMVAHYNGASWRFFSELFGPTGRMRSVAVVGDEAFVVGNAAGRAVVYHGKR